MVPMPPLHVLLLLLFAGCAIPAQLGGLDRDRVAGRTYVITGASSGIGRGVALRLASYGANIVLAARRTSVLDEVARQARAAGGQALVVMTDVSDPDQMTRLQQAALQRFGQIDVWINDAAVAAIGPFDAMPLRDHDRVVDVNPRGHHQRKLPRPAAIPPPGLWRAGQHQLGRRENWHRVPRQLFRDQVRYRRT